MKNFTITENELRLLINKQNELIKETLEVNAKHPKDVAKSTKQINANEYSKTLAQLINYYKKCCLKEETLKKELLKLQEVKKEISNKLMNNI